MTDADLGVRAQRRHDVTRRLETVAIKLFAEQGYANVTTTQIAEAAGVSQRTFFRHFPGGKDDVMLTDVRNGIAFAASELLGRPPHEDILAAVRITMSNLVARHERALNDELTVLRRQVLNDTPFLQGRAIAELRDRQDSLVHQVAVRMSVDPDRDFRPSMIVGAYLNATQVALIASLRGGGTSAVDLLQRCLDILDYGFRHSLRT